MSTSVTVVIAAYNAERLLTRAVQSALDQSHPPHEIIVVDDASADATCQVATELSVADSRVRLLSLPANSGPARARNAAFAAATGDWIAVLDADDAFTPGRLAALVAAAERTGADIVLDNFVFHHLSTGTTRPSRIPAADERVDLHRFLQRARAYNYEPTWTLLQPMFRTSFLRAHGLAYPEDVRHGEDFLLMVEAYLAGAKVFRLGAAGYFYTARADGASTTRLDYISLTDRTRRLIADQRLRSDPTARRLLRRRLGTLECRQAAEVGPGAVLSAAVRRPGVAATLARRAVRRTAHLVRHRRNDDLAPLL